MMNRIKVKSAKILFVCLGNICRSPAAEGVMRKMLEERELGKWIAVESAGVGGWHVGELPDRRMRRCAFERGYNLTSRAQQFDKDSFSRFDFIVVMDNDNYMAVNRMASNEEDRLKVLQMKDYFIRYKGCCSVPDPYYGDDDDFNYALDLIEDGCEGLLIHKILKE